MATFHGTNADDQIDGTEFDDLIFGYAGSDRLSGLAGNDTIDGHSGNDTLSGGDGDDHLLGGTGEDTLTGGSGNDRLLGGVGSDVLDDGAASDSGTDIMSGGAGWDLIVSHGGGDQIDGGDADDPEGPGEDTLELHLETAADEVSFSLSGIFVEISDGTAFTGIEIFSFFSSSGNDVISLPQGDPGFVAEMQNYVDGGAGDDWIRSFDGASPDGYVSQYFDTLLGGDGNDTLIGALIMGGGAGNDLLIASDVIEFFDDELVGGSTLLGDAGRDILIGGAYTDGLVGGEGDDTIYAVSSQEEGGWANFYYDRLRGGEGADVLVGGDGGDHLFVTTSDGAVDRLTGGLGTDEYRFEGLPTGAAADIVTDFTTGAGGDSLGVRSLLSLIDRPPWLDEPYDPFALGYLRLRQVGADTVLQFDIDGAAGSEGWASVVVLKNVTATDVTYENFESWRSVTEGEGAAFFESQYQPVYGPAAGPPPITGTTGNDTIEGSDGTDTIRGLAGNDVLNGLAGDDTLVGGSGWDRFDGGSGNDWIDAGNGNDNVNGGWGDDFIIGGAGDDTIRSGAGNDTIEAGDGDDFVRGGAGNDIIVGGAGDDELRGGGGLETFRFAADFGNDVIKDYADGDTLVFAGPLIGGMGAAVNTVAELKAFVASDPALAVDVSERDVVVQFAGDNSLTFSNLADEWFVV